tara:strand:+ start:2364 stop:2582 length:219 start_codon:yes stop_codon:yes gene_type:complete
MNVQYIPSALPAWQSWGANHLFRIQSRHHEVVQDLDAFALHCISLLLEKEFHSTNQSYDCVQLSSEIVSIGD